MRYKNRWTRKMPNNIHAFLSQINKSMNRFQVFSNLKRFILKQLMHLQCTTYTNTVEFEMFPTGVNVLGLVTAEMGLGQSTRLVLDTLEAVSIETTIKDFELVSNISRNNRKYSGQLVQDFKYNMNIIHLNPPELMLAHFFLPSHLWKKRYNIGFWLWELETLPKDWIKSIKYVDEIWTPSEFISKTVRKYTQKPVHTMRYPIHPVIDTELNRSDFNLPENRFLFITLFDFNSTLERKNPMATIEAYRKLESVREDVGLIIKINHVNADVLKQLDTLTNGLKHVYVVAKTLSDVETHSLIHLCDALISLHRAEGFGLTMAEAMFLGIPAIATNWSANTEFMKADNSCIVDFDMVDIEQKHTFYESGNKWADAHVDHALSYMLRLVENKEYYRSISKSGEKYIKETHNLEISSKIMKDRIQEIERGFQ